MKMKLTAVALFAGTIATVLLFPTLQGTTLAGTPPITPTLAVPPPEQPLNERPRIDVVFALDTTGSMSGLIAAAKEKIWSIATTMASAQPTPEIRMGLVAYRDRGDAYVTRRFDLTSDLDSIYAQLMEFQAAGGGDGPESVNQALHEAVSQMAWSEGPNSYRVLFLVGDAPPHMDYQDDVKYMESLAEAQRRGIVVNAIQCGRQRDTETKWLQIAQLGGGNYLQVDPSGNAVAIATPFDRELAELSAELDKTRLYYGSEEKREQQAKRVAASDKLHAGASLESRARRATFNASKSGKLNFLGEGELVDDVASGRVDLATLDEAELPAPLQALKPAEREAAVEEQAERRKALKAKIETLADQRSTFLREQVEAAGGAKESLDRKIYDTVRSQATAAGLSYGDAAPSY